MYLALVIALLVSLCLVLVRALCGPSLYDRLLAVNSAGTKVVILIAAYGFLEGRPDFVDISLLYALINYIGTIAVLKFFDEDLGSGALQEDDL